MINSDDSDNESLEKLLWYIFNDKSYLFTFKVTAYSCFSLIKSLHIAEENMVDALKYGEDTIYIHINSEGGDLQCSTICSSTLEDVNIK